MLWSLYLLFFICWFSCIFTDVCKSGCASLDDRMIPYNEVGSGCSLIGETVMTFALKEWRKLKNDSQDSQSLGCDLNMGTSQTEARVLTIQLHIGIIILSVSYSYLFCPWPSYQPAICLCVLTILKSICRSLSLTSLRLYQSLASHSPKIASRWCTPRSRRGLSQPSHMCWASWYLPWVRRWALACCCYSSGCQGLLYQYVIYVLRFICWYVFQFHFLF